MAWDTRSTPNGHGRAVSGGGGGAGLHPIHRCSKVPIGHRGGWLGATDMVIGVEIEGEARAYPLRILNLHEMVNDRLAGQPIAVIYCPLRRSELVFSRSVGGETLTFGVPGQLLEANLMLYDRQTETYWSQIEGQAIVGPPSPRASHSVRARSRHGASGARAILTPRYSLGTSASTPTQPTARTCTTTTRTAAGLASA
jgi:hypothetical protein